MAVNRVADRVTATVQRVSHSGVPSADQHYRGAAGQSYHREKRRLPDEAYGWVADLRREKLQPFVPPGAVVVEFGVGAGWNLAGLQCRRAIGIDVADFLAEEVRGRGIEFHEAAHRLDDVSVDVVICHHMLEHVISPAETLSEIRRVLKPGGSLLLFVPYESQRQFRSYDPTEPNHHLFSWNVQTMAALVAECGFEIRSAGLGEYGYDRFAAATAARLRLGESAFRPIRRVAHLVRPVREVRVVAARPVQ